MGKAIFSGYGMFITQEDGKYYINYDAGGITNRDVKSEISEEEFNKAKLSEQDAYEVIISTQVRDKINC
ncbi:MULTISPECIES: hypothetical protein [Pantoea]|jgi:hypothetical protein|uniref:Uncharacterized protein n=2 Tax=Pantoea ananas TaxID=553 RepID=D4GHJ7_PANAM|nr:MULTISPECIES: hypothetical protein [Pantoea]ADD77514.1 Hypothetical Protein PANA_2347 [Pantoea ananatis LMG 20103]ERM12733.1 hypothetical protein L585_00700 [Pantoea ananatis BRT175]KNA28118.1 hypothetical protein ACO03_03755 [Pantoea ananatis]MBN6033201.1 hypothetical protein [Pantoea ananatis]MCS3402245.1 hypothetical protein [Pantoea sp. B566]